MTVVEFFMYCAVFTFVGSIALHVMSKETLRLWHVLVYFSLSWSGPLGAGVVLLAFIAQVPIWNVKLYDPNGGR